MAEAEGHELCPLCVEPLDATDRAIRYCACGYRMCLWCWHQIMETAGKENQEGRCPNCRTPYQKDKVSMCHVDQDEIVEEKRRKKTEKDKRRGHVANVKPRKHLQDVRILQRNLVYAVGLSLGICNEETLKRVEYFGEFGNIKKISVNRSSPYSTGQSRNGPTGAAYVTYHADLDAANCIDAMDGAVWDGRYVRACYGTTKYCAAFLKGVTCNNADCLYMHSIAVTDDTFTKEDMLSGFGNGKPPFYHLIYFDRSKGPVPGSLAIKPPKGPAGSGPKDVSLAEASKGMKPLPAHSSGEGQDWPELNRHSSSLESNLREGTPRDRNLRDGTPRDLGRRDRTPKDSSSWNDTPIDGTPRGGTARNATPRDGTPRNGTPRDGTLRRNEEGNRHLLSRRASDGSWTQRSAGTPRSPMQGQSSGQVRQEAPPKKALAVLSSPLKVKMVTRPPAPAKAPQTPESRATADRGDPLVRPDSRSSDAGGETVSQDKSQDRPMISSSGKGTDNKSRMYSRSPLRSRPSQETFVAHHSQEQASCSRNMSVPRLLDSNERAVKDGQRSPCPAELSVDIHVAGSHERPSLQDDGVNLKGTSKEAAPQSDSLLGGSIAIGGDKNGMMASDDTCRPLGEDGQPGEDAAPGAGQGLPPALVKSRSSLSKGVSRRGPPPGFENSFTRRTSSQSEATGQNEKDEEVPVLKSEQQQTLQTSQGVPMLGGLSETQQLEDAASSVACPQVLKQNELDMNVTENRPRQDIAPKASMSHLGVPAELPGSLPIAAAPELSVTQMQSLLLGLTSQPMSPPLLQLDAQQIQPAGIPAQGMLPGMGVHLGEQAARHLPGFQGAEAMHQPLQPHGLFHQHQVQSPPTVATNSLLDLLRQLQLGPVAKQKVPPGNGFYQHAQDTLLGPLNDPAVLAVKKASEKPAVASRLPSSLFGASNQLQGQNYGGRDLLMYEAVQQQQQQGQQTTILNDRQLGLGVHGLRQLPNTFVPAQYPQTPFAIGDGANVLSGNGLLGHGNGNHWERQLAWSQMNSQPGQAAPDLLASYMASNATLMGHNISQATTMLGAGAATDSLLLDMVPGVGRAPQVPLQMMGQSHAKLFASQGAPGNGVYGPL